MRGKQNKKKAKIDVFLLYCYGVIFFT